MFVGCDRAGSYVNPQFIFVTGSETANTLCNIFQVTALSPYQLGCHCYYFACPTVYSVVEPFYLRLGTYIL